jgi:hypothetical protein
MIAVDEDPEILLGSFRSTEVEAILASYDISLQLIDLGRQFTVLMRASSEQGHGHRWLWPCDLITCAFNKTVSLVASIISHRLQWHRYTA